MGVSNVCRGISTMGCPYSVMGAAMSALLVVVGYRERQGPGFVNGSRAIIMAGVV